MTREEKKLRDAWLVILSILKQTGYDKLYGDEIMVVAKQLRKDMGLE